MVMYGADTQQLRELAQRMSNAATSFDHMSGTLGSLVVSARWDGSDGIQFLNEWNRSHRPALRQVVAEIRHCAERLTANAQAQDATSRDGGGGISGLLGTWIFGGGPPGGLPDWFPHLPFMPPHFGFPGGWAPWMPGYPGNIGLPGIDGFIGLLPWRALTSFPVLPRLDFDNWGWPGGTPHWFPRGPLSSGLFLIPEFDRGFTLFDTAQDGWAAALDGDTSSVLRSVLELGQSVPGLDGYAGLLDTGWTGFDAALNGDSSTAIHSTLDLAKSIPGLEAYAGVFDTGFAGIEAALNGDTDTAVRSMVDLAWTGVGSHVPQIALAKGAWDLGWEVGQQIYGVGEVLGINDAVQDTIINDVIERDFGGEVPHDFGSRYDGLNGFGNFVGDSGKSLIGKINPFD